MDSAKVAGILLAAGRGTRFGGNKLEAMLGDKMLGLYAAQTLAMAACSHLFAVHNPAYVRLASALQDSGFVLIDNNDPAVGQAHSLALAVRESMRTDAASIMICLGDMPFVSDRHLSELRAASHAHPDRIIASAAGMITSPPAIVPRSTWPKLLSLQGDAGARPLLKQAICIAATAQELTDVDSQQALAALQPLHNGRN